MANKKNDRDKNKHTTKETYIIPKSDKRLFELIKVAKEIVFREDELLFKELAKH